MSGGWGGSSVGKLGKRCQEKRGERERSLSKWRGASVSEPGAPQAELRTHLWNNGHWQSS